MNTSVMECLQKDESAPVSYTHLDVYKRQVQTDFGGALTIMPDISHGFVYTKQLNFQTGSADFAAYQRVQEQAAPQQDINLSEYVKKSDFDELARRFNALCDQLGGLSLIHILLPVL